MTHNIGELLKDAQLVKEGLCDYGEGPYIDAIDRIIAYFQERYVPPSEPGSYKDTRGILAWQPGDESAEDSIRRIRGG